MGVPGPEKAGGALSLCCPVDGRRVLGVPSWRSSEGGLCRVLTEGPALWTAGIVRHVLRHSG